MLIRKVHLISSASISGDKCIRQTNYVEENPAPTIFDIIDPTTTVSADSSFVMSLTELNKKILTAFENEITGAPTGGVLQKRYSAVHIQLAGKFLIASGLCSELLTFSNIGSQAGWEILTFLLVFQAKQKELCELAEETLKTDDD